MINAAPVLELRGLKTEFFTDEGAVPAVNDVSFSINAGEVLGLVGESGCGKSVTALSIMRLLSAAGRVTAGEILLGGVNILRLPEREMEDIRGNRISMVFQEPMTSLNPLMTIGNQVAEPLILHKRMRKREALERAIEILREVRISDPERRVHEYPHQLSGGMRQRVMIAMAIACHPSVVIADEPTTALDVTIQAQILDLLQKLREEFNIAILLITHALGVVAEIADRVAVMYAGRIVEDAPVNELFSHPCHPYAAGLLDSIPRITLDSRLQRLKTIDGTVPDLLRLPAGCAFMDRCKDRMEVCASSPPPATMINAGHSVKCYKY